MAIKPYINGESYPLIDVYDNEGTRIDGIHFDLCGEGGLRESYDETFSRAMLRKNGRFVDYNFLGVRILFTLDYSDYIVADQLFLIEQVRDYFVQPTRYKLFLTPRFDVRSRKFEVRLEDAKYELALISDLIGHTLPVIKFITTELVPSKDFHSIADLGDPVGVTIDDIGNFYGILM